MGKIVSRKPVVVYDSVWLAPDYVRIAVMNSAPRESVTIESESIGSFLFPCEIEDAENDAIRKLKNYASKMNCNAAILSDKRAYGSFGKTVELTAEIYNLPENVVSRAICSSCSY